MGGWQGISVVAQMVLAELASIRSPQAMPEGNQDHGGVRFAEGQLLSDIEDIRKGCDGCRRKAADIT
jgi:hypothetical protein